MPSLHQQRLISMLDYLEEWDKLNRTPIFDIASHQALMIWQQDVAELPGFSLNSSDESGEVWLTLDRLRPTKPPQLPVELVPWVVVSDDPSREPHRRESIPHPTEAEQEINFDDVPERETAFTTYIDKQWSDWSIIEKPKRRSVACYDKLFNLLQTIETEGAETALELVWGMGVAVWKPEQHQSVRHPLLCRLVEIDPVGKDMALRIRPRDVPTLLETDIFVAMGNPGLTVYEKAARSILNHTDNHITPFEEASFEQILSGAAGTLDRQARYWPRESAYQEGVIPSANDQLTITNTWVIFARRKGTNFLVDDVCRLRAKVASEEVPEGAPMALVETPAGEAPPRQNRTWRGMSSTGFSSGWSGDDSTGGTSGDRAVRELFFPKPFNLEQIQIIDRLEQSDGVVVQGPPGTGKTHTIANVICHYLAEGKRVLVTSKGESALAVLRDQLPAAIQDLTVSLLTSERDGLKQLEQGIAKITTEVTALDPQDVRRQIDRLHSGIGQLHQGIAEIDRELASWAKKNMDAAPSSLGGLKPAEMARAVLEQTIAHEWFPDSLDSRPEHEVTFPDSDMAALAEARQQAGDDIVYLKTAIPGVEFLPSGSQMADLHRQLLEYQELSQTLDDSSIEMLRGPSKEDPASPERLNCLLETAEKTAKLLREGANTRRELSDPWVAWLKARHENQNAATPVFAVVQKVRAELDRLATTRRQFIGVAVEWLDEWDDDAQLLQAVKNEAAGKSAFTIVTFGKKAAAKQRLQKIRLNGQSPNSAEDWQRIESHAVLRRETRIVVARWNALRADCPSPLLPVAPAEALRMTEEILGQMTMVERWVTELAPNLEQEVQAVFADVQTDGVVDDPERMERLAVAIDLRVRRKRLENAKPRAAYLMGLFKKSPLPAFAEGLKLLECELGNSACNGQAIEQSWSSILDSLARLRELQPSLETINRVTLAIEHNGASVWAEQLRTGPVVGDDDSVLPSTWASSWRWRRQFGHLLAIDGRERMLDISKKRIVLQNDLGKAYASMVEQLTWLNLKETLDKDRGLMAALQLYKTAIRSLGAGTGVMAKLHRANARRAMLRANKAVRCWIMPHWRVSESLPSDLALFDLVILDEASQSDMWALPAILRGKKLLVVGDDKQVSPSTVGMGAANIMSLHSRFLRVLPFGDVLTPGKSIYDLASVMFASDLVRMREHFRCVEPIIEFSNQFYGGEIKCLRVPTATERITPPLVDVYVKDGARDGRGKVNRVEAQAIVNEIKTLTSDPQFAKRSIGVVSLLGGDQTKLISGLLVAEIGTDAILAHQIRCGDAMTFQGREADIILISMVSDADTVTANSGAMFEQRFNVAMSRARDRVYLFRSFKLQDLSAKDLLRTSLLTHFTAPLNRGVAMIGRNQCESDFEKDVYDKLNAAGYRILPQVRAGGYRIDLVVEGTAGRRLAVECDGDQYHGPDVWMDDLQRQRTLERAGWCFWRCWGSSWVRDPEGCFRSLVEALEEQGVDPIGGMDSDLSDVVEYREVYGFPQEELSEPETMHEEEAAEEDAPDDCDLPVNHAQDSEPSVEPLVPRRVDDVDDTTIRQIIQTVLGKCPNQTCTVESLPTKVLKAMDIRTRSGPRAEFAKRVQRMAVKLEKKGVLERYTATNERFRLLAPELF